VSSWLDEADEEDRSKRLSATPETRQYRLDMTEQLIQAQKEAETAAAHDTGKQLSAAETKAEELKKIAEKQKQKKKEPGKLPKVNQADAQSSRDAAADMLKKFFNRR
jgi:hypothetical protein